MPQRECFSVRFSLTSRIEAIRKSGGRLNDFAIPEMHDYLRRTGYHPADLDKLNVVHITGTKGKGSTSAFTERILRAHLPGRIGERVCKATLTREDCTPLPTCVLCGNGYGSTESRCPRRCSRDTFSRCGSGSNLIRK